MTCSNCGVIVMTDQQLAIQAVSDAQRILEEYLESLDRTITSASLRSWWRCSGGPTLLSPSIACSGATVGEAKKNPPGVGGLWSVSRGMSCEARD